MKQSLWQQLIPPFVAAIALAYLIYVLAWQKEEFNYLHFLTFLVITVLLLAPFARRLRVPNIIEFDAKIDYLREETKKEMAELRNMMTATIQTQISPAQHQYTFFGASDALVKHFSEAVARKAELDTIEAETDKDRHESEQQNRLRTINEIDNDMFILLFIVRAMQIGLKEHRPCRPDDLTDFTKRDSTSILIDQVVSDGMQFLFTSAQLPIVEEGLQSTKKLLELYWQVRREGGKLPPQEETDGLVKKANNASQSLLVAVSFAANEGVLFKDSMLELYEEIQKRKERQSR